MTTPASYEPGEFCWVDLSSKDIAEAEAFYAAVFGWKTDRQDTQGGPPYSMCELAGLSVAGLGELSSEMQAAGVPPMWNVYVKVDDVEHTAQRATELGGTVIVPPMTVMDAGRLAFVADPEGATLGLWQADQHPGAGLRGDHGAMCWHELATRDLDAASKFYGALFGWSFRPHDQSPSPYLVIERDGKDTGGLLGMTAEWGEIPAHWGVYFQVHDAQASCDALRTAGGTVRHGPFGTPVGPIAVVADAHGAGFYLMQPDRSA